MNCIIWKRLKKHEKEAGIGPFFKQWDLGTLMNEVKKALPFELFSVRSKFGAKCTKTFPQFKNSTPTKIWQKTTFFQCCIWLLAILQCFSNIKYHDLISITCRYNCIIVIEAHFGYNYEL